MGGMQTHYFIANTGVDRCLGIHPPQVKREGEGEEDKKAREPGGRV